LQAIGLYLSETDREAELEEGELVSDEETVEVQTSTKLSASFKKPPSSEPETDDPCVRKPMKPAKVFAPKPKTSTTAAEVPKPSTSKSKPKPTKLQKLKTQLQPFTTPAPTMEQAQQAMRRTKSVTTSKLVRQAVKLDKSAADIADHFAVDYSLKAEERRQVIPQVRIARMSQRSLAHKIRRHWKWTDDISKREFLKWLDHELSDIEAHTSESDEA